MSRKDQYSVSVSIDGTDYGVWDTMSGGDVDSDEKKYKPGGMAPEISLGGSRTVNNVKVSRLYDLNRDHPVIKTLMSLAGLGTATVKKQPLDVNGNTFGAPIVYQGKLKTVTPPDADSESGDAAMVELEVSSAGVVG